MNIKKLIIRVVPGTAILFLVISGCATQPNRPPMVLKYPASVSELIDPAWHNCYFRIAWPEDRETQFEIDLLIAHQIIAPVLTNHSDFLYRWRFHRRAARDSTGHQFSFIFYTGANEAVQIIDQINQSELRQRLVDDNYLEMTQCSRPDETTQKQIQDASDGSWPEPVQRHWPTYIMGVSMTWLAMIDDVISSSVSDEMELDQMIDAYEDAEEKVSDLWTRYGQHAFLHHLNAIFGYESLLIRY